MFLLKKKQIERNIYILTKIFRGSISLKTDLIIIIIYSKFCGIKATYNLLIS